MKKIFFLILGITLSIAVVMNKEAASQDKKAPKIRIGEFTGSTGEAVDETESATPQSLTDSDVEFMYGAGFFDDEFFRQRISVAYNLFYIQDPGHFTPNGFFIGNYGFYKDTSKNYSNGIAIQYRCGVSFIRDFDWRGNPLFGVNLLLDGSFGSGRAGNIITLGIGGEVHFLWIFNIAVGSAYIRSDKEIFKSGVYYYKFGDGTSYSTFYAFSPLKDKKSATLGFLQGGISIPVSNKFDVFALVSIIEEEFDGETILDFYGVPLIFGFGHRKKLDIVSFRSGVTWKF